MQNRALRRHRAADVRLDFFHYVHLLRGFIRKSKTIPIAGTVSAGLNYHVSYNLLNAVKTWGITVADGTSPRPSAYRFNTRRLVVQRSAAERQCTQFADIFFTPVVAAIT